jgi:excisionase family DNA binding protein
VANELSPVDAAFEQLYAALDGEITELNKLGGQVFHDLSPIQARGLLQRAHHRDRLRECLKQLQSQWKSEVEITLHEPPLPPVHPAPVTPEIARRIKGISISTAAEKLTVSEGRIIQWLEAGKLKGFRLARGRWRIPEGELQRFALTHRELIKPYVGSGQ